MGGRMDRERRTVDTMVLIFCSGHHGTRAEPCRECTELREYAHARLARCRYQDAKPTCANCPIHCYRPDIRDRVREVMRYSGPRMLLRHPVLAVAHIVDGRRRAPNR